jgi:hypothetical protein
MFLQINVPQVLYASLELVLKLQKHPETEHAVISPKTALNRVSPSES